MRKILLLVSLIPLFSFTKEPIVLESFSIGDTHCRATIPNKEIKNTIVHLQKYKGQKIDGCYRQKKIWYYFNVTVYVMDSGTTVNTDDANLELFMERDNYPSLNKTITPYITGLTLTHHPSAVGISTSWTDNFDCQYHEYCWSTGKIVAVMCIITNCKKPDKTLYEPFFQSFRFPGDFDTEY